MSRCTQVIGLHDRAESFLNYKCATYPTETCPHCKQPMPGEKTGFIKEVYDTKTGRDAGMFDDGPDLYEYTLKDGKKVREIVQADPWSSGPMIFLCLLNPETGERIGEWSESEIENYVSG